VAKALVVSAAVERDEPATLISGKDESSTSAAVEDTSAFDAAYAAAIADIDGRGLRVVDLKKELASLSLPQSGVKSELVHRLATAKARSASAAVKPAVTDVTSDSPGKLTRPAPIPPPSPELPQDVVGVIPDDDDFKDAPTFSEPTVTVVQPQQLALPSKPPVAAVAIPTQLRRPPVMPPKSKRPLGIACGASDIRTHKRPANVSSSASQPVVVTDAAPLAVTTVGETAVSTLAAEAAEKERLRLEAEEAAKQAMLAQEAKRQAELAAEAKRLAALEEAARQAEIMEEARRQAEAAAEAKRKAQAAQAQRDAEAAEAKRLAEEAEAKAIAARNAEQERLKMERTARQEAERRKMLELAENVKRLEELARKRDEERKKLGTPLGKPASSAPLTVAIPSAPKTAPSAHTSVQKLPPLPPSPADSSSAQVTRDAPVLVEFQPTNVVSEPQPPSPQPLSTESVTALWSQHIDESLFVPTPSSASDKSCPPSQSDGVPLSAVRTPGKDEDEVMDVSVTPLTASAKKPAEVIPPQPSSQASTVSVATTTPTPKKITPPVPPFAAPKPLTPKTTQPKPSSYNNYELSDREGDSDEESDEENTQTKNGKRIADWARPDALEAALKRQFGGAEPMDPEAIFGEIPLCDLERKQMYMSMVASRCHACGGCGFQGSLNARKRTGTRCIAADRAPEIG
jgi:chemotaxis protein histidine kinase CheA